MMNRRASTAARSSVVASSSAAATPGCATSCRLTAKTIVSETRRGMPREVVPVLAVQASNGYDCQMERGAIVRGHLHGRVIELDEPVDDVEEGEVEVQIRSVDSATPRTPDLLEVIASLPAGNRTKADYRSAAGQ